MPTTRPPLESGQGARHASWILAEAEIARPSEPWYTSVRRLADGLMGARLARTGRLEDAIEAHADELELPDGVECPVDVIPVERRHALRVTEREWALGRDAEHASSTIDDLRDLVDSVDALDLTPRSLARSPARTRGTPKRSQPRSMSLPTTCWHRYFGHLDQDRGSPSPEALDAAGASA